MEVVYFKVEKEDVNSRLDLFIKNNIDELSRTFIQDLIKKEFVKVNDLIEKANYKVSLDDYIEITIPDPVEVDIQAQDIPLDIYYEDDDVIVINKPSNMVVHPAVGNYSNTLVNALMYHCESLPGINGVRRAGIVHRIDKDTSGLIVACKNELSLKELSKQFLEKTVTRKYVAIAIGVINHNLGKIDAPIGRDINNRQKMAVVKEGKYAVTHFKVLERFKNHSFIECVLETGRTHQIRVHMQYIGFPILGDPLYGPRKVEGENGQFLHAQTLGFIHPRTNKYLEFNAPIPEYFTKYLNLLKDEN